MKGKTVVRGLAIFICLLLCATVTALAQDNFCEGNFDFDNDQDGPDAFKFKEDFGRNTFNNPCPPDGPAPVAKTGQTTSYGAGDDGNLKKGMSWPDPRFVDNGNGTIADKLTGLVWLKNANCFGMKTWDQALLDCNGLATGSCNLTDGSVPGDWRLPNIDELLSLIDRSHITPALPSGHPFTSVQAAYYWSSTTSVFDPDFAWYVWFDDGFSDFDPKAGGSYVWPVRGGR